MNKPKNKNQVSARIRTGDEVVVIAGKSRNSQGKVDRIDFKNKTVYIAGTNIYKRHTKPGGTSEEGGILEKVMPVDISNVMLVDPKNGKPTRVGYKSENGKKIRFAKSSGATLAN